jgi:hypothetical protein
MQQINIGSTAFAATSISVMALAKPTLSRKPTAVLLIIGKDNWAHDC